MSSIISLIGGLLNATAMIAISKVNQEFFDSTGPITLYFLVAIGILLVEIPAVDDAQLKRRAQSNFWHRPEEEEKEEKVGGQAGSFPGNHDLG